MTIQHVGTHRESSLPPSSVQGYGVVADFDGQTLTLRATNAAARAALLGTKSLAAVADRFAERAEEQAAARGEQIALPRLSVAGDSIAIPLHAIVSIDLKRANVVTNGNLIVHTADGKKYQAHFRRKQAAGFAALFADLGRYRLWG